ncbi:MAG: Gldg family protein [Candidatus Hydrogenedentales bacterium]
MRNVFTIMRRDLAAYFTSPIGYIFMIVFVAISVGLYVSTFFAFPVADMRPFFANIPLMLCIFIPAVTMRVWAEERKENTWEMLLTFPMRPWELVIGKFFAGLTFFAITLAATFTVPMMLISLGNPDNGAILTGYLGTLLLGAFFLSIGIFFSGFYKDQIIAFVVTLLVCFAIFLLGTTMIASILDDTFQSIALGSLLAQIVGLSDHFNAFTRGVIELADVIYFLVWIVVFLALNIIYIDGRSRPRARTYFATALVLSVGIGLLFNWLVSGFSLARFDVTEDKLYTVSPASGRILSELDTPVQVKYYVTPKSEMPTLLATLEQDVLDKLEELRIASDGNIEFQPVHLNAANALADAATTLGEEPEEAADEEEALEKRMLEKGIQPYGVQALSEDQMTSKYVYSTIGVAYKDREEELIAPVMPEMLPELEYRLVSSIYKLTREEPPVVALVAPQQAVNIPPEMRRIYEQMGQPIPQTEDPYSYLQQLLQYEKYDVRRVELTQESPLPEEFDTLVVINPRELNERQLWEINRAIVEGKSVLLAVQQYEWDYRVNERGQTAATKREENPNVDDILAAYGVTVDNAVLMDTNNVTMNVSTGNALQNLLGGGYPVDLPMQILVSSDNMSEETAITDRIPAVFYLWGTALNLHENVLEENKLDADVMMWSSNEAWSVSTGPQLMPADIMPPPNSQRFPLMAMVTGQFPDAFEGEERPAWPVTPPQPGMPPTPPPADDGPAPELTPAPGKLILIGSAEMFRNNFLQQAGHMDLFLNAVDAISLSDDIAQVRSRKPMERVITQPKEATRTFWKFINYVVAPGVIAVAGIAVMAIRRRRRNAYTMRYANA